MAAVWNPADSALHSVDGKSGFLSEFPAPRHSGDIKCLIRPGPLASGNRDTDISRLGGSARSEFEAIDFQNDVIRTTPAISALVLPVGVANPSDLRWDLGKMYTVDGLILAMFLEVLGVYGSMALTRLSVSKRRAPVQAC